MPYLHFETLRGYEEMVHHISMARAPQGPQPEFEFAMKRRHPRRRKKPIGPAPTAFVRTKKKADSYEIMSITSDESDEIKISGWRSIFHRTGRLRSTLQGRKGRTGLRSTTLPKVLGIFSTVEKDVKKDDLEQGKGRDSVPPQEPIPAPAHDGQNPGNDESRKIDLVDGENERPLQVSNTKTKEEDKSVLIHVAEGYRIDHSAPKAISSVIGDEKTQEPTASGYEAQDKDAPAGVSSVAADVDLSPTTALEGDRLEQIQGTPETTKQVGHANRNSTSSPRADAYKGKATLADIPQGRPAATEDLGEMGADLPGQPRRPDPRRPPIARVPLGQLDEVLIKAYSLPSDVGQLAPLQLRRTLDQYFYTHLASTHERDTDQVVLRYTQEEAGIEPKIFMVDQLWMWVLNGGKSIFQF